MLRLILVYSASTGLQRAVVFLAIPVLARSLSLEAIGVYALVQTTSQLLIPALTLNAAVALTREALEHPQQVRSLLVRLSAVIVAVALLSVVGVAVSHAHWFWFAVALGCAEAAFTSSVAVMQGMERSMAVAALSLLKSVLFASLVVAATLGKLDLESLLALQVANSSAGALIAFVTAFGMCGRVNAQSVSSVTSTSMLQYSAATLPHTAALWLGVSSDRILLSALKGAEVMGAYALAYTVAQVVTLFMSGVITALPPRVARDPEHWRNPAIVSKFVWTIAVASIAVIAACQLFLWLNETSLVLIDKMPDNAPVLVAILGTSFFGSMFYVLFASYLYLNRNTGALAKAGWIVAPVNASATALAVWLWSSVGAALGVLVCYASFAVAYGRAARTIEPWLRATWRPVALAQLVVLGAALAIAYLLS